MSNTNTETARNAFYDLFTSRLDAGEFENQALSCDRSLLPECAQAVLDDRDADSAEYWRWLADQALAA